MVKSIYHLLLDNITKRPEEVAAKFNKNNQWQEISWRTLYGMVTEVAQGLISIGVKPNDRVAILSKTRLEWTVADLGVIGAGACVVPIYHSSVKEEILHILNDSGSVALFVEDQEQLEKIRSILKSATSLVHVICFDESLVHANGGKELSLAALIAAGQNDNNALQVSERVNGLNEKSLATVVYTSGTTGSPKGVMITHDNLLYEASAIEKFGLLEANDRQLLFLPLAHIFAKILQVAWLKTAHILIYATSFEKVVDNMAEVSPTIVSGVPRFYEKMKSSIVAGAIAKGGFRAMVASFGFAQAQKAAQLEMTGRVPASFGFEIAKDLVFKRLGNLMRERFGGRLRFFISGGAPLSPEVTYFFKYAGITILEGYGLTESTGATCVNIPASIRIGTVGRPVPGTEIKIAEDGEILIRGRGVFAGYWNKPKETKEVLEDDGWFHTGDIGVVDRDGFLRITDRKKDIIVTANGKNVAPQKIENLVKQRWSVISHVVLHGDQRPYLVALVTLDEIMLRDFAKKKKIKGDYTALVKNQTIARDVRKVVDLVNSKLPSHEQIKKFIILDHDLKVGEELTPTLKVKRGAIVKRYQEEVESLYSKN